MDQNILNKIVEEHKTWIKSNRKKGRVADFKDANLEGVNLSGLNFDWVDFSNANLENAILENASFQGANFSNAILNNANLNAATLIQANLSYANMNSTSLIKAKLQPAISFNAKLNFANLSNANLSKAELHNAKFKYSILDNSNLQGAELPGANFKEASLHKANLYQAVLQDVKFEKADLEKADLRMADLSRANLRKAHLQCAKLNFSDCREADLRNANLEMANLEGANLQWANLQEANLKDSILMNAKCLQANLCKANIEMVNFDNTNLQGIIIDKETASKLPEIIWSLYSKSLFVIGLSEDDHNIARSIEFPPEYHQAGISILNYFGTVLRKKYPDQTAKVRIEQEGLKVSMIIETLKGDRQIIEHALDEFGLVITGQLSIDEYTDDKLLRLELENKLTIAEAEIKMQMKFIEYQGSEINKREAQIDKLLSIVGIAIQNPGHIRMNIPISSKSEATSNSFSTSEIKQKLFNNQHIFLIQGGLKELREHLPQNSDEAKSIEDLQQRLYQIEKFHTPEEVAKSSAMSKFRRFLENVEKAETTAGKIIKTTKDGIDIARQLAVHYNQIAQWCGLPQVPEPFVKRRK